MDEMVKFQRKMHISNVTTLNINIPFSVRMREKENLISII